MEIFQMGHEWPVEFHSVETGQKALGPERIAVEMALKHVNVKIIHNTNNDWLRSHGSCWDSV